MSKRKKPSKAKPKLKRKPNMIGSTCIFNGKAYIVMTVDTLESSSFEQIHLTAIRYRPIK